MQKLIIGTALSVVILVGLAFTANAATLTVTKIADTNDNVCNADCSLREAIAVSVSGDTIQFASPVFDTSQTIALAFGELTIDKNLTINGRGASLTAVSGENLTRVIRINSGSLTLNGLTVIGGRVSILGDNLGGGIYNNGNLTINNSAISANSVRGNQDLSIAAGGGIYNEVNSSMTMANSTVSGNLANGDARNNRGGGIYNAANTTVSIAGSTVSGNTITVNRIHEGAGIWNASAAMTISNSTISGNRIFTVPFSGDPFTSIGNGGGIFNTGSAVITILNGTISGNSVSSEGGSRGGGIYNEGTVIILNGTITGNSNSAVNNNASGGGIFNAATVRAVNTIISGNASLFTSDLSGSLATNVNNYIGGSALLAPLDLYGGSTQTHDLLSGSPATNSGNSCVLTANACGFVHTALTTDQRGTGFPRLFGTAVDIGAVEVGIIISPPTLPLGTKDIAYSQAITASGGGMAPYSFTLNSGTLPTGITLSSGGSLSGTPTQEGTFNFAVRATDVNGLFAIKNYTLFIGYYVLNANNAGAGSLRQMIADRASGDTISFDPVFFSTAQTIALGSILTVNKTLTIVGPGAGLLTIDGQNITRVLNVDTPAILTLSGVRLTRGSGSGSVGGCVLNNANLTLRNVTVESCFSIVTGGAIFSNGPMLVELSTINASTADFAGGIYNSGGQTANINYTTVSNNISSGGAGGVGNAGTVNAYGSTFVGNTAAFGGAATAGPLMILNNSTVSGNLATTNKAGGVYIGAGERFETTNATITNNVSNGNLFGGIYSDGGVFQSRNSIIAGNRNGDGSSTDVAGSILSYGYNIIGTTSGNSFSPSSPVLLGNRVNTPANLAPLANYGGPTQTHALLPTSQAINNGDPGNSVFLFDQRGVARPIGSQDIGSFERNLAIDQVTLANGNQNIAYNRNLTASRLAGQFSGAVLAPFTFTVVAAAGQSLPPGLTLSSAGVLSGIPTTIGLYTFTVKATDTDGMAGVQQYAMYVFAPTAANVSVSGRLLTSSGQGLRNAVVVLTGSNGVSRTATSTSFGYFRFDDVVAGETYTVSVQSKRFTFAPRLITINDAINDLQLTAEP